MLTFRSVVEKYTLAPIENAYEPPKSNAHINHLEAGSAAMLIECLYNVYKDLGLIDSQHHISR